MDSLLAVRFRSYIIQIIQKARPDVVSSLPKNIIYHRPSINRLTDFIVSSLSASSPTTESKPESEPDITEQFRKIVERFTSDLSPRPLSSQNGSGNADTSDHVLLTGTTGSLGSFLLVHLINQPNVERIYCFNRRGGTDTIQRQLSGFKDRGLDTSKLESAIGYRVKFFDVDLSRTKLGLSDTDYEEVGVLRLGSTNRLSDFDLQIRTHVTRIIHGAWQLNFNLRLEGFERVHIAGVRHLIDIALSSPKVQRPRLVFLSSISAVANYRGGDTVPEERMDDASNADLGYGLSKLAGEKLVEVACEKAGLNATIIRIGQIS